MNTSTPLQLGPEFGKYIIDLILKMMDDSRKEAISLLWGYLISFLTQNWGHVLLYAVALLILSFMFALAGRWSMLGSVLYRYLYFGALLIIGAIFGPHIFLNIWFDLISFIVYKCSYESVGKIIDSLGLRNRHGLRV
jgi:hypothetical protein